MINNHLINYHYNFIFKTNMIADLFYNNKEQFENMEKKKKTKKKVLRKSHKRSNTT